MITIIPASDQEREACCLRENLSAAFCLILRDGEETAGYVLYKRKGFRTTDSFWKGWCGRPSMQGNWKALERPSALIRIWRPYWKKWDFTGLGRSCRFLYRLFLPAPAGQQNNAGCCCIDLRGIWHDQTEVWRKCTNSIFYSFDLGKPLVIFLIMLYTKSNLRNGLESSFLPFFRQNERTFAYM